MEVPDMVVSGDLEPPRTYHGEAIFSNSKNASRSVSLGGMKSSFCATLAATNRSHNFLYHGEAFETSIILSKASGILMGSDSQTDGRATGLVSVTGPKTTSPTRRSFGEGSSFILGVDETQLDGEQIGPRSVNLGPNIYVSNNDGLSSNAGLDVQSSSKSV